MRALVLSGGGSRGAYQAGVLRELTKRGRTWDVIAGVSVGALNGAQMAQFSPPNQKLGAELLEELWRSIEGDHSVYRNWFWGYLSSLSKGGLYDTAPLEKLIRKHLDPANIHASGVKLRIGAVSYRTGQYHYITEKENNLVDWIMASSAFPVAFPPRMILGDAWVDGGVRDVTPIRDVLKDGVTEIDVVMCAPRNGEIQPANPKEAESALNVGLRSLAILTDEVLLTDLQLHAPQAKIRVYAPSSVAKHGPLDFNPRGIDQLIRQGISDTQAVMRLYP